MPESHTIFQQSLQPKSAKPKRRQLLGRVQSDLPPLRLTQRDIAIVNACYEYRALSTPQIKQLFFNNNSQRSQLVQCQYRLKLLYHNGYLYRDEKPTKLSEGRHALIYFLDRKGAQLLAECLEIEQSELDWHSKSNAAGARHLFLDHLLRTNDIRIALTMAAEHENILLERWLDDKTLKSRQMKDYVTIGANDDRIKERQRIAIIPDGYFHLKIAERSYHHFLETDLRTVTGLSTKSANRDWSKKIQAYLSYHSSGLFQARYNTNSFRVLTVTTGEKRLANLKRITEEAGGKSRFWFTTFDQLTQASVLSQPIWQIAGRVGEHNLVLND